MENEPKQTTGIRTRPMSRTRRRRLVLLLAVAAGGAIAATPLYAGRPEGAPNKGAQANLVSSDGKPVGVVRLYRSGGKFTLTANVKGLQAGFHGFHVHAVGACKGPDFASAGSHLNPGGGTHPGHAGDMPVLLVNGDGTAQASFRTDRFRMAELLDADGSAIIIHAAPDNYANIPTDRYEPDPDETTVATGDAGARVACGVVTKGLRGPDGEQQPGGN